MLKTVIIVGQRRDKTCLRSLSDKARLNPVYSATETSKKNEGSGTIKLSDIFGYLRELKPVMRAIYSEIVTLVIILLVIPAAKATSERTFSALRRVKTYLRSTMTQTRMDNLITLYVHKERTDALDLKAIANEFTAINERRRCMF